MNRKEWLKWRQTGIGSSDAPAIHGKSEWATPRKVAADKWAKEFKEEKPNWAMDKGNEIEPILRLKFAKTISEKYGIENVVFEPKNLTSAELPILLCSLDGFFETPTDKMTIGMEAKFMGQAAIHAVKNAGPDAPFGGIPENYWIQMQHQFLVANLDHHFFIATSESKISDLTDDKIVHKKIERDDDFIKEHVKICTEFWKMVKSKTLPPPMRDDLEIITDKKIKTLADQYKKLDAAAKKADQNLKKVREQLIKKCKHTNNLIGDVKVFQSEYAGSVDYSAIPQLQGIDLDQYRKPSSTRWTVKA